MITSHYLFPRDIPLNNKPMPQSEIVQKPTVTVRHKINTSFGSINSDLILEAIDVNTGEVVKTKTHRICSFDVRKSKIIVYKHEFAEELRKDGLIVDE
ncbi:hypothetical protein [Calidifontibacillus erzurumensis]|uniref:Uncharacterized protein n=1 Tax=Calidifontibacillus erzurumensis TaxID=2741433 RepID=A0A8J8GDK8_9BACI|nr:hypothetical protein [Calidifontibacillus erzurumensis]NSL51707.1 hypothetical protein [Calidifontibacillus erzurumensis]